MFISNREEELKLFFLPSSSPSAASKQKAKVIMGLLHGLLSELGDAQMSLEVKADGTIVFDNKITFIYAQLLQAGKDVINSRVYSGDWERDRAVLTYNMQLLDCAFCYFGVEGYPDIPKTPFAHQLTKPTALR